MTPNKRNDRKLKKRKTIPVMLLALALLVFILVNMAINSVKPKPLNVKYNTAVKGSAFVRTNQALIKQMVENWMPNDIFWPTVLLDNMPNFQLGELEVVRYNVRVLRDNLSRMRTTDKLDMLVDEAFTALANDPYKWWFPSAESKWKRAYEALEKYHRNLEKGSSSFYPRADNLIELLSQYASLMGGVNTRLIHAPHDIREVLALEAEKGAKAGTGVVKVNIPWYRVDDNFYYAQGVAYALNESFRAIRVDFINVLTDKNSLLLVDKILEDLRRCNFEPLIVFNGDPGSIFANHSLNLSGIFNDARQKINSLIVALREG
ncbi:MAG: DUF2333 family protein [Deltaproteobacteria bacterium]|nr:DUF2333 family protein [Deltaproteobacteria bacterium]MBW1930649.1 DUF2333 family protein [Deltaproteobacteria bacterium]MBW2023938.1 DUF2333 family protein [Deltaproteobacteria bacterium]MBW2124305.1 DUF2333 family protein [Deltaproteobacteria bacterium]RLB15154.1 MAG: hypothetical protein DRG63_07360 [Deltaproteobacteria bacterium]